MGQWPGGWVHLLHDDRNVSGQGGQSRLGTVGECKVGEWFWCVFEDNKWVCDFFNNNSQTKSLSELKFDQ